MLKEYFKPAEFNLVYTVDAVAYGVPAALFVGHLRGWLIKNQKEQRNIINGYVWTYQTLEDFGRTFPFWKIGQIRRIITKLKTEGAIIVDDLSPDRYRRVTYYTMPEFRTDAKPRIVDRFVDDRAQTQGALGVVPETAQTHAENSNTLQDRHGIMPKAAQVLAPKSAVTCVDIGTSTTAENGNTSTSDYYNKLHTINYTVDYNKRDKESPKSTPRAADNNTLSFATASDYDILENEPDTLMDPDEILTKVMSPLRRFVKKINGNGSSDPLCKSFDFLDQIPESKKSEVLEFCQHWSKTMGLPIGLPKDLHRDEINAVLVYKRLYQGYGLPELKNVVSAAADVPFIMGQNKNKTPYNSINHLLGEKSFETHLNRARSAQKNAIDTMDGLDEMIAMVQRAEKKPAIIDIN